MATITENENDLNNIENRLHTVAKEEENLNNTRYTTHQKIDACGIAFNTKATSKQTICFKTSRYILKISARIQN